MALSNQATSRVEVHRPGGATGFSLIRLWRGGTSFQRALPARAAESGEIGVAGGEDRLQLARRLGKGFPRRASADCGACQARAATRKRTECRSERTDRETCNGEIGDQAFWPPLRSGGAHDRLDVRVRLREHGSAAALGSPREDRAG